MIKEYYTLNDMKGYVGVSTDRFMKFIFTTNKGTVDIGELVISKRGFFVLMQELGFILRKGSWHKI